ncbi:hypothetical protein HUK65_06000 [Rhodobacteraceae bacterium 2376]|uniref:Uncharacterized protein n=1 Tax=Rhabdonatronobacter sediminivivens TaxID=2743469 RepID=A0A7Z0HYD2_9RHOB|nr:dockerin type I domain-containing protein [Rhabdonatronobacter sediminivivens]NYS24540.1 hypothetical protein [Rhabdonatronobacter sediminivivens]
MTYQLFPATAFTRPHADDPGAFREPDYAQLTDGSVIAVSTQQYRPDPDGPVVNRLVAHRFDPQGVLTDTQVLVQDAGTPFSRGTEIIGLRDGGFVVSFNRDGSDFLHLRSFDADGTPRGDHAVTAPPRVFDAGGQEQAPVTITGGRDNALSALEDGGFALGFSASHASVFALYDGAGTSFTQVFDADATPRTDPLQIAPWVVRAPGADAEADSASVHASVPLADGGYAVILRAGANTPGGVEGQNRIVAAQMFNADGTPRSDPFAVASAENHDGSIPHAAALADGSFVVAWVNEQRGSANQAFWRRYDGDGTPLGDAVQVAPGAASFALSLTRQMVTVSPTEDGGFFITGHRVGADSTRLLQRYDAEGQPVGGLDATLRASDEEHFGRILQSPVKVFDMGDAGWLQLLATQGRNDEGPETIQLAEGISARMHAPDILGSAGDDTLEAGDTGTALYGFDGDDTLIGGPGDDIFIGGPGDDVLIGGGGQNMAVFGGTRADYDIQVDADGTVIVSDLRADGPNDGTDRLQDIQLLQFARASGGVEVIAAPTPEDTPNNGDDNGDDNGDPGDNGDTDEPGTLAGLVTRPGGDGLGNVSVTFTPADSEQASTTAQTDAQGRFTLEAAPGAAGTLEASRDYDPAADGRPSAIDALEVLRLAVGLNPSFGPAQALNFIAADMNGDGTITALDALEVLRAAVGLASDNAPRWVFVDSAIDWEALDLSRSNVQFDTGITIAAGDSDLDLGLTGILLGNMAEVA